MGLFNNSSDVCSSRAVDLGLSVRWAGYNLGAFSPEQIGDRFAWGETCPKRYYSQNDSATFNRRLEIISGTSYDAARARDHNWRMPRWSECVELMRHCRRESVCYQGKWGVKLTSSINGKAIFFPYGGQMIGDMWHDNEKVLLWTGEWDGMSYNGAYGLCFDEDDWDGFECERWVGMQIRPVCM